MFDPNKLLPKSLAIVGADTHLYRIGLSLFKTGQIKRRCFNKPHIIFIISTQILIKCLIYLKYLKVDDPVFHLLIGNIPYFTGTYLEINICICAITLIALGAMILNWYNYLNDIKPDNRIFEMMAGMMKPKYIGIYDEILCLKLLKISKRGLFLAKYVDISIFILIWIILFSLIMPFITSIKLLIIAILHVSHFSIGCLFIYRIIVYQAVYYYIITYYLKLKLVLYNDKLKSILKIDKYMSYSKIFAIIRRLYKIHNEINDYNCNYWSKYLCIFWFNITAIISLMTASLLFSDNLLYSLFAVPVLFFFIGILFFTIHISAIIYIESYNSYKLFNSLFVEQNYNKYVKFKVKIFSILNFKIQIIILYFKKCYSINLLKRHIT